MTEPTPPTGGLRKHRRATFVQIPSATIRDRRLSFRARGVLAWLLDQPDGWDVRAAVIAGHGLEGRDAIEAALRELREAGYYRLERRRTPAGVYVMGTAVAEEAQDAWAASHAAHGGRAVPVVVDTFGRVTELEPAATPVTASQGPEDRVPEDRAPVDRSPTQKETQTETQEGGTSAGYVTSEPTPVADPPSRTCTRWPAPHGACGACATDREAQAAWETTAHRDALDRAYAAADLERRRQAERRQLADAELEACPLCGPDGVAELTVDGTDAATRCQHNADRNTRAVRERRTIRAGLAARPRRGDNTPSNPTQEA